MNINFPHLYVEETESTNVVALDLLSKTNPPNGFLVITDYQTAGKGQYGRTWQSERGKNLLFSLILGPLSLDVNNLFRLHLASSLALIRGLQKWNLPQLRIKWPNDIYVGSKKLAGILIQNQLKGTMVEWSVIGMGINVNQREFPGELSATSLQLETGREIIREEMIMDIRFQITDIIATSNDWELLLEEYNSFLYLKDQMVSCVTKDGNKFDGKINCVTMEGKLRIEKEEGGCVEFEFGEMEYKLGAGN